MRYLISLVLILCFAASVFADDGKVPAAAAEMGKVSATSAAEEKMPEAELFTYVVLDPVGDDTGDGDYVYPTEAAFGDGGQADILALSIDWNRSEITFTFKMKHLVDPWNVGNRLTMVAAAIDNKDGGDTELRHNANAMLKAPSEFQIFAGGGTVEMLNAAGEKISGGVKTEVDMESNTIAVIVSTDAVGMPDETWKFTVAAGLQDDFGAGGLGDFRGVNEKAEQWRGGGGHDLAIDSNIYDLILPNDMKDEEQAKVLGDYSLDKAKFVELPFFTFADAAKAVKTIKSEEEPIQKEDQLRKIIDKKGE
jgi:carbohydrate-binding DOMON domain-containing protein